MQVHPNLFVSYIKYVCELVTPDMTPQTNKIKTQTMVPTLRLHNSSAAATSGGAAATSGGAWTVHEGYQLHQH